MQKLILLLFLLGTTSSVLRSTQEEHFFDYRDRFSEALNLGPKGYFITTDIMYFLRNTYLNSPTDDSFPQADFLIENILENIEFFKNSLESGNEAALVLTINHFRGKYILGAKFKALVRALNTRRLPLLLWKLDVLTQEFVQRSFVLEVGSASIKVEEYLLSQKVMKNPYLYCDVLRAQKCLVEVCRKECSKDNLFCKEHFSQLEREGNPLVPFQGEPLRLVGFWKRILHQPTFALTAEIAKVKAQLELFE